MRLVLAILLALGVVVTDFPTVAADRLHAGLPAHHAARGFRNPDPDYAYTFTSRAIRFVHRGFESTPDRGPLLQVSPNDGAALRANGEHPTVTWVGHSTLLIQLDGVNILTDPHWGPRASPVSFAGPKRLIPPGVRFADLPPIDAVVISHDHYDHLDEATVRRLAQTHHPTFFVPLGLKAWFASIGIHEVVELDWWEAQTFHGLRIVCTPARHSSGRGLYDQNLRLWASWVIVGHERRMLFAGDTGYGAGFSEIGWRLGPFDLAAIPIGGYSSYTSRHPNHVNPEEALTVFQEVGGRRLVPVHWGTFDMNREPFSEPPRRLMAEAHRRGIDGEISLLSPGQTIDW